MRRGLDLSARFGGLYIVHQNLPGMEVAPHSHREHLLFIPLQGEVQVRVHAKSGATDGAEPGPGRPIEEFRRGPGHWIYLPPDTPHSFESSRAAGERLIALISPTAWRGAGARRRGATDGPTSQLCKELLFHLLLHPKTRGARGLVTAFIQTLDESLEERSACRNLETVHLDGRAADPRVRSALQLLRANLAEAPPMARIARGAGLSLRSFNRLFLAQTGLTPKQALTRFRVQRARELLATRQATVTEAALEAGYASLSQFIRVFRAQTGQLPSEFARVSPIG